MLVRFVTSLEKPSAGAVKVEVTSNSSPGITSALTRLASCADTSPGAEEHSQQTGDQQNQQHRPAQVLEFLFPCLMPASYSLVALTLPESRPIQQVLAG